MRISGVDSYARRVARKVIGVLTLCLTPILIAIVWPVPVTVGVAAAAGNAADSGTAGDDTLRKRDRHPNPHSDQDSSQPPSIDHQSMLDKQERADYRARMGAAKSPAEREKIRAEYQSQALERYGRLSHTEQDAFRERLRNASTTEERARIREERRALTEERSAAGADTRRAKHDTRRAENEARRAEKEATRSEREAEKRTHTRNEAGDD